MHPHLTEALRRERLSDIHREMRSRATVRDGTRIRPRARNWTWRSHANRGTLVYLRILSPIPPDRRPRRLAQLLTGLMLYGVADGLLLRAALGVDPWDVLHQGLSRALGLQVGDWTIIVGAVVLLGWIPLRQRPGLGTVANVVFVGLGVNATLAVVPVLHRPWLQAVVLVGSILLIAIATGLYIGSGLGPGPRDGLMTGVAAGGHSIRVVRTVIELLVLLVGWRLGGNVGIGTLVYALSIGPLVHVTLPALAISRRGQAGNPESVGAVGSDRPVEVVGGG